MRQFVVPFAFYAVLLTAVGCSDAPPRADRVGIAFAGPTELPIRQEIALKSPVAVTVKHGDKLEVLQLRRRFMRVRAPNGTEGWVDSERLLTEAQMDRLRKLSEATAKLPVQGEGTVFEARNVHTEPHRQSPSFYQIKEEGRFYIVGHKLVERTSYRSEILKDIETATAPPPRKKKPKKTAADKKRESDVDLPPMPAGPPLPKEWQQLSFRLPPPEPVQPPVVKDERRALLLTPPKELPRFEDWSLIRTKDGHAGWILTRSMNMAIPDEVGKYAEGQRITSWFELGEVRDGDQVKKHYVWTTIPRGGVPYEFDGFRVFIYRQHRHRYETAYRERNVKGYFPTTVHPVEVTERKRKYQVPGFSLILEDEAGKKVRKTYAFEGYRVRLVSEAPWTPGGDPLDPGAQGSGSAGTAAAPAGESWWERLKKKLPWG